MIMFAFTARMICFVGTHVTSFLRDLGRTMNLYQRLRTDRKRLTIMPFIIHNLNPAQTNGLVSAVQKNKKGTVIRLWPQASHTYIVRQFNQSLWHDLMQSAATYTAIAADRANSQSNQTHRSARFHFRNNAFTKLKLKRSNGWVDGSSHWKTGPSSFSRCVVSGIRMPPTLSLPLPPRSAMHSTKIDNWGDRHRSALSSSNQWELVTPKMAFGRRNHHNAEKWQGIFES